jgi:predicted nucleic acid-binding protein
MSVDFIDSNIFVYVFDEQSQPKQAIARSILNEALNHDSGVISFQVVQETMNVLTRKLKVNARPEDAIDFMRKVLEPMWRVQPSADLYASAIELQTKLGFSFYDSLIVAAAQSAGCTRLLTEDLQHGQRIGTLRIENPFQPLLDAPRRKLEKRR